MRLASDASDNIGGIPTIVLLNAQDLVFGY